MDTPNPLAHGNRLQRAYYRWALPHYDKIGRTDPVLRERVELTDIHLYTRSGLGAWAVWWLVLGGFALSLNALGHSWPKSLGVSFFTWSALSAALLGVWLAPVTMKPSDYLRKFLLGALVGGGAMSLLLIGIHGMPERLDPSRLVRALSVATPLLIGALLLLALVGNAGRAARDRQLARLQLVAERDAAARNAAEADLRLLQAQIHPHFVFNTLATLQHWVDRRDERAGPLLRELTGFLRRSTEMLGRPAVPLAEEAQAVRHYLAILAARLDGRVQGEVDIAPALGQQLLPPGLVLTLVENAVEHGLEPKIGEGRLWLTAALTPGGGWWLRVDDDGLGLADDAQDHVGLANLRRRLQHHFGDRARFTLQRRADGGTRAQITLTDAP
jgi:signal transduction histidine kinase